MCYERWCTLNWFCITIRPYAKTWKILSRHQSTLRAHYNRNRNTSNECCPKQPPYLSSSLLYFVRFRKRETRATGNNSTVTVNSLDTKLKCMAKWNNHVNFISQRVRYELTWRKSEGLCASSVACYISTSHELEDRRCECLHDIHIYLLLKFDDLPIILASLRRNSF